MAAKSRSPIMIEQKYSLLWTYIGKLEQEPGYKKAVQKIVELEDVDEIGHLQRQ
jgi:hypothetical protein